MLYKKRPKFDFIFFFFAYTHQPNNNKREFIVASTLKRSSEASALAKRKSKSFNLFLILKRNGFRYYHTMSRERKLW